MEACELNGVPRTSDGNKSMLAKHLQQFVWDGAMDIAVHNLTAHTISIARLGVQDVKAIVIESSSNAKVSVNWGPYAKGTLIVRSKDPTQQCVCQLSYRKLRRIGSESRSWRLIAGHNDGSIWRIYACFHGQKVVEHGAPDLKLIMVPRRDMACFLKDIDDHRRLSDLCLAGTHDTLARYGWPISQCQYMDTPVSVQLQQGIRALDIRMAVVDGCLIAYHGSWPQRVPFQDVLADLHAFLTNPQTRSETIIMSMKQEDFETTPPPYFSSLVHNEMLTGKGGRDMWFLENRIPTLGEVRGKVVMLSRFGGDGAGWDNGLEGMGIHPTAWPDSYRGIFEWRCKDALVRTSDWYRIPSFLDIPEKVSLATSVLLPPTPEGYEQPTLNISYISAASLPLALPPVVSQGLGWPEYHLGYEGANSRLGKWVLEQIFSASDNKIKGWIFMDFYNHPEGLVPVLVECNFL